MHSGSGTRWGRARARVLATGPEGYHGGSAYGGTRIAHALACCRAGTLGRSDRPHYREREPSVSLPPIDARRPGPRATDGSRGDRGRGAEEGQSQGRADAEVRLDICGVVGHSEQLDQGKGLRELMTTDARNVEQVYIQIYIWLAFTQRRQHCYIRYLTGPSRNAERAAQA